MVEQYRAAPAAPLTLSCGRAEHLRLPPPSQGLKHSLQDMGMKSLPHLWEGLEAGELRFELRTAASQVEGGIHDLHHVQRKDFA